MENKVLLQDLFAGVSQRSGTSKKDGETFVRSFFEVLEQYLLQDKIVKIKGLGTFKIVEVSGRDSVNVNTGERIHIKGHSKVTFTPDTALRDHVNRPFADFETVILNEGVDLAAMEYVEPDQIEPEEADTADANFNDKDNQAVVDQDYNQDIDNEQPTEELADSKHVSSDDALDSTSSEPKTEALESKNEETSDSENSSNYISPLLPDTSEVQETSELLDNSELADTSEVRVTSELLDNSELPDTAEDILPPLNEDELKGSESKTSDNLGTTQDLIENNAPESLAPNEVQDDSTITDEQSEISESYMPDDIPSEDSDKQLSISQTEGDEDPDIYDDSDIYDKQGNNWVKLLLTLVIACLLLGAGYLAGTHHIFNDECSKLSFVDDPLASNVVNGSSNSSTENTQQHSTKTGTNNNSHNPNLTGPSNIVENESDKDKSSSATETSNSAKVDNNTVGQSKDEKIQNTSERNQTNHNQQEVDDPSKYSQVNGGEYEIVGIKSVHRVKAGESVNAIARRYFGDMEMSVYIIKLNNLRNPEVIEIGDELKIPRLRKK